MATQHDGINPHTAADLLRKAMLQKSVVASPLPPLFVLLLLPTPSGFLLRLLCPVFLKVRLSQLGPLQKCHLSLWLQHETASMNAPAETHQSCGQMRRGRCCCLEGHLVLVIGCLPAISCSFHFHMEFHMSSSCKSQSD